MDRRTFNKLAGLSSAGAITTALEKNALGMAPSRARTGGETGETAGVPELILEDDAVLVAFDQRSGALTRMLRKSTSWAIQLRPEFGVSFRIFAPVPGRRDNFVLGPKQKAVQAEKVSNREARFQWTNLVSEHGGVLPMTFSATVTLDNGAVTFKASLENHSQVTVETIDYPYLGDLNAPTPESEMSSEHMWYDNLVGTQIHPHFHNESGYWGVRYPRNNVDSKQSLFCLIQAPEQGIYVGMQDPTQPYLLQFIFEQHPGVIDSVTDRVPLGKDISGIPVHLEFRTCHFVFTDPNASKTLAPVVLNGYDGDWHAGVDVYDRWRATWFKNPPLPQWVKSVHSWLQLQVNGAEQDYSIPYSNLKPYIDECAANNVEAIQLVGWNKGGQDGGDPSQDVDSNLGTWQDLRDAIVYAQNKGVKMILFGKLYWADLTTRWYKEELYKYQATDPYGIPYQTGGYSYSTPTQLAGINNRRRAIMDVQSQAYRDIATTQFKKILALGSAGWLFDEVCHHGPVEYSFSPNHGYPPPGYIYGGDMPLARQFRQAADAVNPDFIFAGEGPQDWLMQYYPVSYFRIGAGSRPVARYIDSQAPLIVAVTGFDDREMLNLILLNRYIISYEPYNFKGHLTDFPLTLAYGKKIDGLRQRYKAWLWDTKFRDNLGAEVSGDGPLRYTVFGDGAEKRAVVVVNSQLDKPLRASVKLPNPRRLAVATPEQPDAQPTEGDVLIPARSAAVLMEQ